MWTFISLSGYCLLPGGRSMIATLYISKFHCLFEIVSIARKFSSLICNSSFYKIKALGLNISYELHYFSRFLWHLPFLYSELTTVSVKIFVYHTNWLMLSNSTTSLLFHNNFKGILNIISIRSCSARLYPSGLIFPLPYTLRPSTNVWIYSSFHPSHETANY